MHTHVRINIEPGIRELFRFEQGIYGNFMPSSVPRQRLFWALFQLPPAIIYKNIYRNVIEIDNDEKLVSSDLRNNYLMSCFMTMVNTNINILELFLDI